MFFRESHLPAVTRCAPVEDKPPLTIWYQTGVWYTSVAVFVPAIILVGGMLSADNAGTSVEVN